MKEPSLDGDPRLKVHRSSSELIRCFASILARAQIEAVGAAWRKSADRIARTFEPRWQELERLSCETVGAPRYSLRRARWLRDAQAGMVPENDETPDAA